MKFVFKLRDDPQEGDSVVIKKFAWLPVKIDKDLEAIVWLETYYSHRKFKQIDMTSWKCGWVELFKHSQNQWGNKLEK